ncbi:hypothetical protein KEM52_000776 [Ascosphaera acerosa]|nr:hypothetical protein KEM52_000776 [Ascosphaera acerosa]
MPSSPQKYSSREDISRAVQDLRDTFRTNRTKDLAWRRWQLKQLWWLVEDNFEALCLALYADLHRHRIEAAEGDLLPLKFEIYEALSNLDKWTRDVRVPGVGGWVLRARVRKEPLGSVLVVAPWNFPVYLLLAPMVSAIAAGCTVLLKPSEISSAVETLLARLVPQYMDTSAIKVVTGAVEQMQHLLSHGFDKIFFTGSTKVGKIISRAAAEHLTPVVLELGGQNPVFVARDADVEHAARTIARGNIINSGQFCIRANHIFADPAIVGDLVVGLKRWSATYLARGNGSLSRMISEAQWDRVHALLEKTRGRTVFGGEHDRSDLFIHPTIVDDVDLNDSLLSEELFAPVIPIIHASMRQAVDQCGDMPSPLALYVFAGSRQTVDYIVNNTTSGGVTVNDVFLHVFTPNAPFGGVHQSGLGGYHGVYGVNEFSNLRTIVSVPSWFTQVFAPIDPPYDRGGGGEALAGGPKRIGRYLRWPRSIGFKRGETLEDQRRTQNPVGKMVKYGLAGAVLGTVLARMGVMGRVWESVARLARSAT